MAAEPPAQKTDYLREVKPLLNRCLACHGPLRQKNDLRLDTAVLLKKGGVGGPAIEVGKSDASLLIDVLMGRNGAPQMPPEGDGEKLIPDQIARIARWIDEGAEAPMEEPLPDPRSHWSFTPPLRTALPVLATSAGSTNPIDLFVAQQYQERTLAPVPLADRETQLRRVTIDLTGLPPTRAELLEFLNDSSSDAYEKVVDRLLASPAYSERWGRHWMDIWRYSDWYGSRGGNELRNSRRHIWRWRDWIIESIGSDKGYDRMLVEMLAPDELEPGNLDLQRAGGFLGRNYYVFNRHVWLQDTVEYTSMALLGITLKCARCHDHKYDPISQEDYYRFRAFFEPYQVRTDPVAGRLEKLWGNQPAMAPPGATLAFGHDIIYDAQPDVPTFLLARGNEKDPVTERPLSPGFPPVLGRGELSITPQDLPVESFYPELRADYRAELIAGSRKQVESIIASQQAALHDVERLKKELNSFEVNSTRPVVPRSQNPFLREAFLQLDSNRWQILSGNWQIENGHLVCSQPGAFLTMTTRENHPQDFQARIKYKTLEAGVVHSVGVSFDVTENARDWQAVYTATNNSNSTVQAFHRQGGVEFYPAAGIIPYPFKLNDTLTVDLAVRDRLLNVWVNGELKIAYPLPVKRQPGRFALWVHAGAAEFYELEIEPLSPEVTLVENTKSQVLSPFAVETRADVERRIATLVSQEPERAKQLQLAQLQSSSLKARVAAEVAKYSRPVPENLSDLAKRASREERALAQFVAERAADLAEREASSAQMQKKPGDAATEKAAADAETKLAAAKKTLDDARIASATDSETYTPLGTTYPNKTSGRRLALAHWLTQRDNPLTARVAVNHMWLRHFGTALVPSVFNFGLNGKRPTHPELLDWLAVELMENGWSTKRLHRLMVTSHTYRLSSNEHPVTESNLKLDRENRFYWRANPRRMEAEVVRDGLLHLASRMNLDRGGPELEPSLADSILRRSLYFRHTPDDRALMLELFDAANASECYQRDESIVPQQALALANGVFTREQCREISKNLTTDPSAGTNPAAFTTALFEHVLSRRPTDEEKQQCVDFLVSRNASPKAFESLVHVLVNYNEFVTIR